MDCMREENAPKDGRRTSDESQDSRPPELSTLPASPEGLTKQNFLTKLQNNSSFAANEVGEEFLQEVWQNEAVDVVFDVLSPPHKEKRRDERMPEPRWFL